MPSRVKVNSKKQNVDNDQRQKLKKSISTLIVFGSGGHTKEMITLTMKLNDKTRNNNKIIYSPINAILAESDERSIGMIQSSQDYEQPNSYYKIPRARNVGQSWLSTPFTTLYSIFWSIFLVFRLCPDLIVCNGPGTCIPICFSGYLLRILGIKHVKIIFCESFCRVKTLSMSGKIMYFFADRFIIHWKDLLKKYPKSEYLGKIC